MDNPKLNPFEIPEILLLIGELLERSDLLNCIRVSKAFHRILISLIWRKITVGPKGDPDSKAVQKHKEYIEEITFDNYTFNDSFPEKYESLQRLQSIAYTWWCSWPTPIHLINQIKAHSSIITILHLTKHIEYPPEFWKVLLECTNLNHLEINRIDIDVGVDLFLQVCMRLRHLELDHITIHQFPINILSREHSEYIFPNIHTLRIDHVRITDPSYPYSNWYCLGMFVRSCPALCSLEIKGQSRDKEDFYKVALLQHPWTLNNLSDLCAYITIEDEDIAALLRRMTELKQLHLSTCKFGQFSLQELLADRQEVVDNGQLVRKTRLRRLCETVETLVFGIYNNNIGGQTILSNCPRLKTLDGFIITVSEIVDGAEWVCTGLTRLIIYLKADIDQETEEGMAKARITFRQLGKLTRLEYLMLTQGLWNRSRRTLDLRLRAGLNELANLKRLDWLRIIGDGCQRMQLEDAKWIVSNWPRIRGVNGVLNDEKETADLLKGFFESHNISIRQ
ncbi:hypothetical protein BCR41DRAFT_363308 [Lobosporangium transversale]|uniref:F-box domain-containing protein n=1 Tax=Lobosporangium transversale TaxID=64571 RepID=A0A1Y2G967_9FUNG|nr:hypothetical protein BCR41DRAFT_363308 [Lobosporangium transversale]ORZ01924.1 hypothetical protein BCR41DRAFT_363308 [Lobosporangium transversale]|eukprot:XP_021876177.1 hypothetical protein BCR41DRAFT_363308 [Lobosporangium transversale]